MPKHSDGPPISGGYRFGGLNAQQAKLPSKAINPRGPITEANAQARKTLADFAAYRDRTKGLDKPLPNTQGVSRRRAAALQRIRELEQDTFVEQFVTLENNDHTNIKLVFDGTYQWYRFVRESSRTDPIVQYSLKYGSREHAMLAFRLDRIRWFIRPV